MRAWFLVGFNPGDSMNRALVLSAVSFLMLASTVFAGTLTELEDEKKLSAAYLEKMALEKGAEVTPEGIVVRPIFVSDTKIFPTVASTITVGYYLTDREGKLVEESTTSDETATFPLDDLIPCWKIAIPKMPVGSFYKVSCPSSTAYGDAGAGGVIKGGAALTFRITLFGIMK